MAYPLGRGVTVEVQKTVGSVKVVSAVTQASPGVATSTSHGLSDGAVGYFTSVEGMTQLEGQAARVDNPVTNAFDLQGLKTSGFPAFTGAADFNPITAWDTVSAATQYTIGGGDAEKQDQTALIDDQKVEVTGLLAAQSVTFTSYSAFQAAAMQTIYQAAYDNTPLVFRITLKDGQQRVFRGVPSVPGEDMQKGQSATGQFSVTVTGRVLFLPAVA